MLELPNSGHLAACTMQFEPRDKILLVTPWKNTMTSQSLFQNAFILRKAGVTNFNDIIKIAIMLIKTTFKGSIKHKRIRKKILNRSFIRYNKNC